MGDDRWRWLGQEPLHPTIEHTGDLGQLKRCHSSSSAFDPVDRRPIESHFGRELALVQASRLSSFADPGADSSLVYRTCHVCENSTPCSQVPGPDADLAAGENLNSRAISMLCTWLVPS